MTGIALLPVLVFLVAQLAAFVWHDTTTGGESDG